MPPAGLDLKALVPTATTTSQTQGPTVLHLQMLNQVLYNTNGPQPIWAQTQPMDYIIAAYKI